MTNSNKKKIIVANWKMNPQTQEEAKIIFNNTKKQTLSAKNTQIVVCPPFPLIPILNKGLLPKNLSFGSQNIATEEKGSYTGEISAGLIKNVGIKYTIIGHSERRNMGETNEIVRRKIEKAFFNKIIPILCIGEKERDKDGTYLGFIKTQIKECLSGFEKRDLLQMMVAYEPIWAIGKSYKESMNPTDIHEMTLVIKKIAGELFGKDIGNSFKILYGGSVESKNAPSILEYGNVDGFLVGHASLIPEEFKEIIKAVEASFKKGKV